MESENKNKIGAPRKSAFEQIEKIHPVKMLLYLCLIGVGVMFLILTLAFFRSEAAELKQLGFHFPKFFSLGIIFILGSSFTMSRTMRYYKKDNLKKLSRYLALSLLIGLAFLMAQAGGWYEMANQGLYLNGKPTGSYLHLISALHAFHVMGGIVFLTYFYFKTLRSANDIVKMLVFIRNPFRKLQLSMLTAYWHFMGVLWGALFVFLLFSF